LPEPLRTVFVLREMEELTTEEVAATLGISTENVRVRLHRAKAALRARLDDHLGREVRALFLFGGTRCDRLVETLLERLTGETTPRDHRDEP
jgi:RNA polymerase sigma-70 factor, ECF subfamily